MTNLNGSNAKTSELVGAVSLFFFVCDLAWVVSFKVYNCACVNLLGAFWIYVGVFLYTDIDKISYKKGSDDDFVGVFDSKSDYFIIELDPYHDHQTSYAFAVNSSGVIADYMIYDDGYIDDNWGTQWESSVKITDKGWGIEYSIPFKNLRLNTGDNLTWGFNIIRYIKIQIILKNTTYSYT